MTVTRRRGPAWPRQPGGWPAAGWYAAALTGAGIAFVCSIPLAARLALLQAADGFVPSTLVVERVASPRRGGGGRWLAYGRLPDGSEARVALGGGPAAARSVAAPQPEPGTAHRRLPVLVNAALSGTWLHRQRVQPPAPALRDRLLREVVQLLATVAGALAVSVLGWRRLRRLG